MLTKTLFDRTCAFFGLIALSPALLAIALLIRIKMPGGPVIFKQTRIGRHGKPFTMYKFRSMTMHHSGSSVSVKGDMSLVGPRPDVPGYADKLQGDDREILRLRPGITGPASLKYRDEEELLARQTDPQRYNDEVIFPDKTRINRAYLAHWSFGLDLKIIFCTVLGKELQEPFLQ